MGNLHRRFGTLQSQQLLLRQEDKGNFCCKKMQWQVCTITRLHLMTILNVRYDIASGIRSERVLSNIFSDIDVWTFQAGSTLVGAFAAAQI
jgi:hypothetical protein